jgi:hypothetical protein
MNSIQILLLLSLFDMNFLYSLTFKTLHTNSKLLLNIPLKSQRIVSILYSTDTSSSDSKKANEIKPNNNSRRKKPSNSTATSTIAEANVPTQEEIRQVRINKLTALKAMGIEPFAYSFDVTHKTNELLLKYEHLSNGEEDSKGDMVSIAGRIMVRRVFGKLAFFTLQDDAGEIQGYIEKGIY